MIKNLSVRVRNEKIHIYSGSTSNISYKCRFSFSSTSHWSCSSRFLVKRRWYGRRCCCCLWLASYRGITPGATSCTLGALFTGCIGDIWGWAAAWFEFWERLAFWFTMGAWLELRWETRDKLKKLFPRRLPIESPVSSLCVPDAFRQNWLPLVFVQVSILVTAGWLVMITALGRDCQCCGVIISNLITSMGRCMHSAWAVNFRSRVDRVTSKWLSHPK